MKTNLLISLLQTLSNVIFKNHLHNAFPIIKFNKTFVLSTFRIGILAHSFNIKYLFVYGVNRFFKVIFDDHTCTFIQTQIMSVEIDETIFYMSLCSRSFHPKPAWHNIWISIKQLTINRKTISHVKTWIKQDFIVTLHYTLNRAIKCKVKELW